MECLRLRVKDVDFRRGEITVRKGKGWKDMACDWPARTLVTILLLLLSRIFGCENFNPLFNSLGHRKTAHFIKGGADHLHGLGQAVTHAHRHDRGRQAQRIDRHDHALTGATITE
jgi:integrase